MNIKKVIEESVKVKENLLQEKYIKEIEKIGETLVVALKNNCKILIAGNGGSAADVQHFAAELVNRFIVKRKALPAIALTTDSSIITSVANDSNYSEIFSRQLEALGARGDIFIGISTSGNSKNIVQAVKTARRRGLITICLLGRNGGKVRSLCDYSLVVPSQKTSRIQEAHILIIHILSEMIDEAYSS